MDNQTVKERDLFWSAVMFYTRIPTPKDLPYSQVHLNRSRKYFPLIGIIIGLIFAGIYAISVLILSPTISVLLAMCASVLATGAFHEDGFADTCDGFGGGWSTEQVLTIMKDSRVGTYATVGLYFMFSLKVFTLLEITQSLSLYAFIICVVFANTISRQISSIAIDHFEYVQDIDASKVKPITENYMSMADKRFSYGICTITIIALCFVSFWAVFFSLIIAGIGSLIFLRYSKKRIGGYTGDVLGATQQISEILILLSLTTILC
jgi:adenosylcobinamide-GDP ribazoletransferase